MVLPPTDVSFEERVMDTLSPRNLIGRERLELRPMFPSPVIALVQEPDTSLPSILPEMRACPDLAEVTPFLSTSEESNDARMGSPFRTMGRETPLLVEVSSIPGDFLEEISNDPPMSTPSTLLDNENDMFLSAI